ncbi:unnamed protein product [Leptosia nina]|uniref:Uncharacterized protein n=1 Tax=Leptosia nina TaxID=320188 RepID=A0AAV1JVV9_9NEOP
MHWPRCGGRAPPEVCLFINKRERYSTALGAVCITNLKEANLEALVPRMVALIFGTNGACRRQELANITTNNIENQGPCPG